MRNERYYYSIMNAEEREAYRTIYNGVNRRMNYIEINSLLSAERIQEIYLRVLYDHPLFYFVNQKVIRMAARLGLFVMFPEYLYTRGEITAINRDIRRVVDKVAAKGSAFSDNEFRLERFLHDSVVKSVAYDYDSLKQSDCFNAHSIIGAFLENKAVCDGISKAFKLLCNEFGIKCIVAVGKADKTGDFTGDDYHAWNLVKIRGESYHVDITWDNMYDTQIRHISYDYFNVTTKEILKDHLPAVELPLCDSTRLSYFNVTKSVVSSAEELSELVGRRINAAEIMFRADEDWEKYASAEDFKKMTFIAVARAIKLRKGRAEFALMFNELRNIAKIVFVDH